MGRCTLVGFAGVAAVALLAGAGGCSVYPDLEGTPLAGTSTSTDTNGVDPSACSGPSKLEAVDPTTLPPCCDGTAHCLANDKVPGAVRASLAPCDDGSVCVPDVFLRSGGAPPPACTAFNGTPGACMSTCVPDVEENKAVLEQATCAASELCTPCINPVTSQSTGVCDIGKDTGRTCADAGGGAGDASADCPHVGPPVLDPTAYPSCAIDAHCLPSALVTPSDAADLAACPGGFCVPDVFIETAGRYIPATCASIAGAEGRCLSAAIPKIAAQENLPQSTCADGERCAPCYDPVDGSDTAACRHACDPGPTQAPYLFPTCCEASGSGSAQGRCVPSASVPASEQANVSRDVCASSADLCVPAENLVSPFTPPACTAPAVLYLGSYTGVCLSDCLSFSGIQGDVVKQGTCDALHQCVPCKTPLGQPSGAPGCP